MDIELSKKVDSWSSFSLIVLLVVFFDQLFKLLLRMFLPSKIFINQNYIFGFYFDINTIYLILFLFLILVWGYYSREKLGQALIFSGGVSNVIDRIYFGGVIDFNFEKLIAFNFADIAIAAGVVYVLIQLHKRELVDKTVE